MASYLWARIRPPKDQTTLRGLGRRPLRLAALPHFFKTYTEKVWGVPATEIPADWAAQRIKNLSLVQRGRATRCCPSGNQKDDHQR